MLRKCFLECKIKEKILNLLYFFRLEILLDNITNLSIKIVYNVHLITFWAIISQYYNYLV